jgi:hypothetical protein
MSNTLHQELKTNAGRLADSIDDGGLDLHDAVIQAMLADGFTFDEAVRAMNVVALAYEVRRRAYAEAKKEGAQ